MARSDKTMPATPPEAVISIIGVGMTLTGDCETDGAVRIEGTANGNVRAGKAVVIGKEGLVDGNIYTQDAVIAGRVLGSVHAESRLELQCTSHISGEIVARRMQLEEGATIQGQVSVGESQDPSLVQGSTHEKAASDGTPEGSAGQEIPDAPAPGGATHGSASVTSASPAITRPPGEPKPETSSASLPAHCEGRRGKVPPQPPATRAM